MIVFIIALVLDAIFVIQKVNILVIHVVKYVLSIPVMIFAIIMFLCIAHYWTSRLMCVLAAPRKKHVKEIMPTTQPTEQTHLILVCEVLPERAYVPVRNVSWN